MGFSIVCHECGQVLYEGEKMMRALRRDIDNRCPNCKRKLSLKPLSIEFGKVSGL
ncbi:MAG: hypothetical protein P8X91_08460 [Candidatus Bathyarchaeota archaeon]